MKKIGLYGGTFNPIHLAHLIMADCFVDTIGLDKCLFIPANISPFKTHDKDLDLIANPHRIKMIELAINSNPKFVLELFEIENSGISYTINTINYIINKYPDTSIYLLIGTDHAINFYRWKDWQAILNLVNICIVERINEISLQQKLTITDNLSVYNKPPIWLPSPCIEISSSIIRQKIKNNLSIQYLVCKEIEDYIKNNFLYR